ncbi:DNA topoisomerase IB [Vannielia litorea]|uniref:DNA topoisomerase IB n=1 Tax=Vannielia litorea TaxID=1217970 RepID=UPI0021BD61A4|nr:DNA topoisomerase IB [Vannielia litorea]
MRFLAMNAAPASLVYYPDSRPGIARRRCGRGFTYTAPDGTTIDDRTERARLKALAVPPAYEDVWISPKQNGHLQATGVDARARKQYRYHPDWTAFRAATKYSELPAFGEALPAIRRRVARDLNLDAGEEAFALAAVIAMIDRLSLRVGNSDYASENGTYGATTLRSRHLRLKDGDLHLGYTSKGGKKVRRKIGNKRMQQTLQKLDDLPGAELVTWVDEEGEARTVSSSRVNAWLADLTGTPGITAKTFRTWSGTVAALEAASSAETVTIKAMSEAAAQRLGNTATIARNSYIHPAVIDLAEDPSALPETAPDRPGLRLPERRLLKLIARWQP